MPAAGKQNNCVPLRDVFLLFGTLHADVLPYFSFQNVAKLENWLKDQNLRFDLATEVVSLFALLQMVKVVIEKGGKGSVSLGKKVILAKEEKSQRDFVVA